jgi:molybdate transport system ATP-binding protein
LLDSDRAVWLPPHKRGIGYVFQDGRLFPHLSVAQNLRYAGRFLRKGIQAGDFDTTVEILGIGSLLARMPGTLSGGEKQRVAIGRALLANPALLVMDEPLSSLDQPRRAEILPRLEAIRDHAKVPILYVSHGIDEVARLADHLVVLSEGKVASSGPPVALFARPELAPVLGRHEAGALIDGVVEQVDATFGLARIRIGDGDGDLAEIVMVAAQPGERVRMRIRARDVGVALRRVEGISIRNQIAATIVAVRPEGGPFAELVLLVGGQRLLARITARSLDELGLIAGQQVVALVKAIAVERRAIARSRDPSGPET